MLTRRSVLVGAGALALAARSPIAWAAPDVAIDPIVEWLATLARAAGFREYQGGLSDWVHAIEPALRKLRGDPAVWMLREARTTHSIGYDAMASLAVCLTGTPEALAPRQPWDPWPAGLDDRWKGVDLDRFLAKASEAAARIGFSAILAGQSALAARTTEALKAAIAGFDLDWFRAFFGVPLPARLRIVASLGGGPNNYGIHLDRPDGREIVPVLGAQDGDTGPTFGDAEELLAHEIGHSFVGDVVDAHHPELEKAGKRLYALAAARMRAEAYGAWAITVEESILRACVGKYVQQHHGDDALMGYLGEQHEAGFPWVDAIFARLEAYDRQRYPTFADFVPELAASLDDAAAGVERHEKEAPHVVRTIPADGARNVDPGLTTLTVEFDRPMKDRCWSVCGDRATQPEMSEPRYDAERRTFTIGIRLEPGREYAVWLNTARFQGFRSEAGEVLDPVPVRFRTR